MSCKHIDCNNKEQVCLPYEYKGLEPGLKPHAFCTKRSLSKRTFSDKPRRLGFYINIVATLRKEVKIAKVQMRLISIELERQGIDDIHRMDKYNQERIFIETVGRYVNVSEQVIRKYLHSPC